MTMTPLEAETVVVEKLRAEHDQAIKQIQQAAREMAALGPLIERAEAEAARLRERQAALAETKRSAEELAAAYAAVIERSTPAVPATTPAPATVPVPAVPPTSDQTPDPVRPYVAQPTNPRDTCGTCGGRVLWDEQSGFSHAEDGTPAGGLCERRWSA